MNWLERARREIQESCPKPTANTVEKNQTAVLAVTHSASRQELGASTGSNGSTPPAQTLAKEAGREDFEERAAIMEFDGGMSRDEAERAAWALVSVRHRLQ